MSITGLAGTTAVAGVLIFAASAAPAVDRAEPRGAASTTTSAVAGNSAPYVVLGPEAQSAALASSHGCGRCEPVDCSTPELAQVAAPHLALAKKVLHAACVGHDYCYRHGWVTYGKTRATCDSEFHSDMRRICLSAPAALITGGASVSACFKWADQMYAGVRAGGAPSYRTDQSIYCEYAGPGKRLPTRFLVRGWFVGDFSGDRKADLARHMNRYGGAIVLASTGTAFGTPTVWGDASMREEGWYVGDFDGDSKDDLLRYVNQHGGAEVLLSTGSAFKFAGVWSGAGTNGEGWYVGDFNGDGRDDVLRSVNEHGGAEVLLSTRAAFRFAGQWSGAGTNGEGWYVGDFNGDGKDDVLRYVNRHGGAEVLLSTGSAFKGAGVWSGAGARDEGWYVGDFNGDRKDDLLRYLNDFGGAEVLLSNGTGFAAPVRWSNAGNRGKTWFVGDYDGDGRDDLARHRSCSGGAEVLLSTGSSFRFAGAWATTAVVQR